MSVTTFSCSRHVDPDCAGTVVELDDDQGDMPVLPPVGWVETDDDELVCPFCAAPDEVADYYRDADEAGAALAEVGAEDRARRGGDPS